MTAKTRSALNTQADTNIEDNSTGNVTPADVRTQFKDQNDSSVNILGDNLGAGFTSTIYDAGTKSSGTFTPDPANGNAQKAVNGGAHTLAPPSTSNFTSICLQYTNNASAGAITTSGFTKVDGSGDLTTTDGHDFLFFITKHGSFSHLAIVALQ